MKSFTLKVLSLCDGVSMGLESLKRLQKEFMGKYNINIIIEYHAVEIDSNKRKISNMNHSGIIRKFHDLLDMAKLEEYEHYDMLIAGTTCTSLSSQGKREEWDGESKIFFDAVKILKGCLKTNPNLLYFFENVASMSDECRDRISLELGLDHFLGESRLVSAQDRLRYYWFNWENPELPDLNISANDILDEDGLHLIAFSKSNRNKKGEEPIVKGRQKVLPKTNTLTTGEGCNGQSTMNMVITKKMKFRLMSISELSRAQGIENYTFEFIPNNLVYEAIGDGWNVPTIVYMFRLAIYRWLFKKLLDA